MALKLSDKKEIVQKIKNVAHNSVSLVVAEYRGLKANQITDLRAQARASNISIHVARNTLAKIALLDTEYDSVKEKLVGPIILAFSKEDPAAAARILKIFVKENEKLIVVALSLNGRVLPGSALETVASLPTKAQALQSLLFVMKAPITKLVRVMSEPYAKLVRATAAINQK